MLVISLIVSGNSFCFVLPLEALVDHRGLSSRGHLIAKLVYLGNVTRAWFFTRGRSDIRLRQLLLALSLFMLFRTKDQPRQGTNKVECTYRINTHTDSDKSYQQCRW